MDAPTLGGIAEILLPQCMKGTPEYDDWKAANPSTKKGTPEYDDWKAACVAANPATKKGTPQYDDWKAACVAQRPKKAKTAPKGPRTAFIFWSTSARQKIIEEVGWACLLRTRLALKRTK